MNSEELKIIESYLLDREKPNYEIAGKLMKICEAMTDEDVKKALLHCAKHGTCGRCTLYIEDDYRCDCSSVLKLAALNIINRQQAEIEKQSQNFKVLVSDHRVLQQSFDNLKGLYEDEKSKVEKAKEKSIYFAKELQAAKAEIERLQKELALKGLEHTLLERDRAENICDFVEELKTIKSAAIKKFAERLKSEKTTAISCHTFEEVVRKSDIDSLVKEMVGDAE